MTFFEVNPPYGQSTLRSIHLTVNPTLWSIWVLWQILAKVGCLPFSHEWQNNLQLIPSNTLHINSQRQYREGLTSKAQFISSHKAITFYKNKNLNPGITKILDDLSRSTLVNLPDTRSPKSGIASAFRHPSQYKSFEPRIFGVASDCSTSCATTTALLW